MPGGLLGLPRREGSVLPISKRLQCLPFYRCKSQLVLRSRNPGPLPPPLLSQDPAVRDHPLAPTQQWLPGDGWEAAVPGLSRAGRLGTAQLVLTAACRPAGAFPRCRPAVRCAAGRAGGWNPKPTEGGAWGPGTLGMAFLNLQGLGIYTPLFRAQILVSLNSRDMDASPPPPPGC